MNNQEAIDRIIQDITDAPMYYNEFPELKQALELAISALEAQQADRWITVSSGRLPECEYGYESKNVLYQLKNTGTIESGYYGSGGKLRDRYFRHLRDSSEGVDISDVIAWKNMPEPWKEEQSL